MPNVTISLTAAQIAAIPNSESAVDFTQRKMRGMLDRLIKYNVDKDFESFTAERKAVVVAAEKAR
jgi:hypothetical protein